MKPTARIFLSLKQRKTEMPDSSAKTISHNKGNLCPSDQKTLAFVLPQPVFYNNRDGYSTNFTNLIDFFISLSDKFKQVVLLLPVVEGKKGRYPLNLPANIKILAIPYISPGNTLWRLNLLFRGLPQVVRAVVKDFANCDIVGFTALTGIGTFAFLLTRLIHNKPGFFLVRGDRLRTATFSTSHRLKRQLKCLRIKLYDRILCTQIRRQFPVFTQGHKLTEKYAKYGKCVYPLNALISEDILSDKKDIISRSNHISDEIRLLYVGRLSGEKNVGAIIKTLAKLKDSYPDITLDVAGTGPQNDQLESLADQLGLSHNVRFLGFVPHGRQILNLYKNSEIFILASLTEGLPRSMILSWRCREVTTRLWASGG